MIHGSAALVFYTDKPVILNDVDILVEKYNGECILEEKVRHGRVCNVEVNGVSVDILESRKLYNGIVHNKFYVLFSGLMVARPEWVLAEKLLKIIDLSDHYTPDLFKARIRVVKQYYDIALIKSIGFDEEVFCGILECCFPSVIGSARVILTNLELWYGGILAHYLLDIGFDKIKDIYIGIYDVVRRCRI